MDSRIALICAPQTFGHNAGMGSVDLAGHAFFKRHFPTVELDFLLLYPHRHERDELPFRYRLLEPEALAEHAAILYWGDFLHAAQYRAAVTRILVEQGRATDQTAALRQVRRGLFLSEADSGVLERCLLFGGTLLFNQAASYRDAVYLDDLRRLLRGARRVWMREPFSALQVSALRGDYRQSQQGIDCALLLQTEPVARPREDAPSAALGVFFGRSRPDMEQLGAFVRQLAHRTGARPEWLAWGAPPFFQAHWETMRAQCPDMSWSAASAQNLPALLGGLRDYACIVTDTYHLCLNAWVQKVPAVCLIDPAALNNGVNSGPDYAWRDKRVVFYWSYDAMPFLVYTHELRARETLETRVAVLAEALADGWSVPHVLQRMTDHRAAIETDLAVTVSDLLGSSVIDG